MKKIISLSLFLAIASCSHLFYQPSERHFLNLDQLKIKHRGIELTAADGTKLHGWHIFNTLKKREGTIVQFHGNAENISTHFMSLEWLRKYGYDLITFDYRGYGKSQGVPSQQGVHQDALAALEFAYQEHVKLKNKRFIVYGQSLGGVILARALADFSKREKIDLVVLDSTFTSYKEIAFDKLNDNIITFILSPLAFILVSDEYKSTKAVEEIQNKTLVIHSKNDPVVPFEYGDDIFHRIKNSNKWFWSFEGRSHVGVFFVEERIYRQKFLDFLEREIN